MIIIFAWKFSLWCVGDSFSKTPNEAQALTGPTTLERL